MKKQSLSLAQLCMIFDHAEASLYCVGRDVYTFDWHSNYIFSLPKWVRDVSFVHCSQRPTNEDHAYFLSFMADDSEEFFVIRGDNNEVVAKLCEVFAQFGAAMRRDIFAKSESEEAAISNCLDESFIFSTADLSTDSAACTEFVRKEECCEEVLARFRHSINVPFDFCEQRKIGDFGQQFSWGSDEDEMSNVRKNEMPLSEIYVRYFDPAGDTDPIEIPLRVDSTALPAYLFDYALLLGLFEDEEEKTKDG